MIKAFKSFLKRLEKTNKKEFGNKRLSCHNVGTNDNCEHANDNTSENKRQAN